MEREMVSFLLASLLWVQSGLLAKTGDSGTSAAVRLLIKEVPIGKVKPDKKTEMMAVSPDGKRVAYRATRGKRELVIIDGVEGKEYADGIGHFVFSPDSKRVAYMATQRIGLDNAGAEAGKRSILGNILGGRSAVSGNLLTWYLAVVVDGVEMKGYDGVSGSVIFSPDSKHVAYSARRGDMWMLVVDGVGGREYDGIGETIVFSPDSQRIAYPAFRGERQLVVVDGVEGKEYDGTTKGTPLFSPDSRRVAYGAQRGVRGWVLVVDGVEGKEYEGIAKGTVVFSPDSRRLAYAARRGKNCLLVLDGAEGREYAGYRGIEDPIFSPDSRRLAFVTGSGSQVVGDDVEGTKYKEVTPPTFSPDSQHVAYKAKRGGKWILVVDGVEAKEAEFEEGTLWDLEKSRVVFDSTTRFHTYVSRHGEIVRVEAEIVSPEAAPGTPK